MDFGFLRSDAGIGFALTIKKWLWLETANPLTIRCDFPLFLNSIPYTDKDYFQFRWVVGVYRSF
jgi:hypothetical protein